LSLIEFIKDHKLELANEIIFFGGSFNPWHEGHSECVRLLQNDLPLIVIPDHNPYKELVKDKSFDMEIINQKLSSLRNNVLVFKDFLEKNEKNPTSEWINELKQKMPNLKLSLLIGFDTFNSIEKWISSEQLLRDLHSLYVASRMENKEQRIQQESLIKQINPQIQIDFLGHHSFEELSSTKLRENN